MVWKVVYYIIFAGFFLFFFSKLKHDDNGEFGIQENVNLVVAFLLSGIATIIVYFIGHLLELW